MNPQPPPERIEQVIERITNELAADEKGRMFLLRNGTWFPIRRRRDLLEIATVENYSRDQGSTE